MESRINILHLEDSLNDSELIHSIIDNGGIVNDYFVADNETDFVAKLEKGGIDIILSDFNLPDFSGIEAFGLARETYANIPFIFVSGTIGEDYAINAMVNGATDYVFKNKLERLVPAIKRAIREIELNLSKRKTDEELRVASVYSRNLLEANLDPLVTINAEGIITDVNKASEQITGVSRDRLIGTDFADYFTEPEKAKAGYQHVFSNGIVKDYPLTIMNVSGNRTDVLYNATIYRNEAGEVQGVLAAARDVTKRKQEEDALRYAKEKAEASDNLKTSFLNNISHEVRTPLNGILGFAEIIFGGELSENDKKESYAMLRESSDRLLNTITNYMDISLIASRNLSVQKKNISPSLLLSQAYDKFKPICSVKKLELLLEIPHNSEHIIIDTDPEIFQKILSHLLVNAVSFTNHGNICFGYVINDKELEFFIRDTGIGINELSLGSIFEHFIKERRDSTSFSEGSGLGLSIAKGMIEALGGEIRVESKVDVGTSFYFTIPCKKVPEVNHSGTHGSVINIPLNGSKILVAEDDRTNFLYIQTLLKQCSGLSVLHALNGQEAIEIFKSNDDIVMVLMDIKMPIIDGYEATRQIKLINKNIPVIAVTAYAMSDDEARASEAGCDGYLSKPISNKKLLDKIAEFVRI